MLLVSKEEDVLFFSGFLGGGAAGAGVVLYLGKSVVKMLISGEVVYLFTGSVVDLVVNFGNWILHENKQKRKQPIKNNLHMDMKHFENPKITIFAWI
jgi:hypothetical protein